MKKFLFSLISPVIFLIVGCLAFARAEETVQVTGVGATMGEEARQQASVNSTRQEVALLGEHEMRALPGPKHVALVHIQDSTVPGAKPFLVDLTANGATPGSG